MASLFKSFSEDMEKIAQVVEEGAKIIMGTDTYMGDKSTDQTAGADADVYDVDQDAFLEDEEDMESPLMGMADSVLSDIMANQVSDITIPVVSGCHQRSKYFLVCRILALRQRWKVFRRSRLQLHGANHSSNASLHFMYW